MTPTDPFEVAILTAFFAIGLVLGIFIPRSQTSASPSSLN
jgi:hypothetical protein